MNRTQVLWSSDFSCRYGATLMMTLLLFSSCEATDKVKMKGHMEKLGSHRDPLGVTMIGKFSNPAVFYEHFVKPSKPLWMRSVLEMTKHPGLTEWTDTFLREKYGNEGVKVELSKKENRENTARWLTLRQFLSLYKGEDIYMVQTLNNKMEDLVLIPRSLQCGGFQRAIQEAVLWLGSGTTKSVLHYDELDNLLCLLDGQKDFVLIDSAYKNDVEADGFVQSGGYSEVDVDQVDFSKFPQLANVLWHKVHLEKGDCLFVPRRWYHQVTSSSHRHMAVNLWFSHLFWFNPSNCSEDKEFYRPLEPIITFGFASPNEFYRARLLEKIHDKGMMLRDVFVSSFDTSTKERRLQFFEAVDRYQDSVLSWSELYGFDIDKAILKFPDMFDLPGEAVVVEGEKTVLYDLIATLSDFENEESENNEDHATEAESSTHEIEEKSKTADGPKHNADTGTCSSVDVDSVSDSAHGSCDEPDEEKEFQGSSMGSQDISDNLSSGETEKLNSHKPKEEL